jgi:hypothetical protein
MKSAFNPGIFLNELAAAYDLAVVDKGSKSKTSLNERDLLLYDLYYYMAPTQRARRDYDLQNFAFDVARLYPLRDLVTKDERGYEFGTSKKSARFIRILDQNNQEQMLGTVRFFKKSIQSDTI